MKILFVADGRSPIALSWIDYFIQSGYQVHLASSFPCQPVAGLSSLDIIPVAMSEIYGPSGLRSAGGGRLLRELLPVRWRTRIRQLLAPSTFSRATSVLQAVIERVQPELVHAMRIPYEGMIASMAVERLHRQGGSQKELPLLVSVWGNDFTLHASSSPRLAAYTRMTLLHSDGLHTDCQRDLNLAREFGYSSKKPAIVLPAGGGIRLNIFFPVDSTTSHEPQVDEGENAPVTIINPRGFRAYVRNDTFFRAIPLVLKHQKTVRFICPGMAGETQAQKWAADLDVGDQVELLPSQSRQAMAELYRRSQISVSMTTHDGTPNTLLEAMACGCVPIAGDIESIREWITPGVNGLLVDPTDPKALADAILELITQPALRASAIERNLQIVKERAEFYKTMSRAVEFYSKLVS